MSNESRPIIISDLTSNHFLYQRAQSEKTRTTPEYEAAQEIVNSFYLAAKRLECETADHFDGFYYLDVSRTTFPDSNQCSTQQGLLLECWENVPRALITPWGLWRFRHELSYADNLHDLVTQAIWDEIRKTAQFELFPDPDAPQEESLHTVVQFNGQVMPKPKLRTQLQNEAEIVVSNLAWQLLNG